MNLSGDGTFKRTFQIWVRQFHADLTATAEVARQQLYPASVRTADFWHTLEAMKATLEDTSLPGEQKKRLKGEVIDWVMCKRSECVQLTEFRNLWAMLCKHYKEEHGEEIAISAFRERYFFSLHQLPQSVYTVSTTPN